MRECGSCSACCKLLEITAERAPEIAKPAGEWCAHCARPGCSIYESRPNLCQDFACQWLLDERLGPEWFPATSGMILVMEGSTLFVVVDPNKPDAHRTQPYAHDLARMESWGKRSPTPFEVRVAEPPREQAGN
jgi:uncharacterized cysteine cluster protein YcgN (CxxCxxCC family)